MPHTDMSTDTHTSTWFTQTDRHEHSQINPNSRTRKTSLNRFRPYLTQTDRHRRNLHRHDHSCRRTNKNLSCTESKAGAQLTSHRHRHCLHRQADRHGTELTGNVTAKQDTTQAHILISSSKNFTIQSIGQTITHTWYNICHEQQA